MKKNNEDRFYCIVIRSEKSGERFYVKECQVNDDGKIVDLQLTKKLSQAKRWVLTSQMYFRNSEFEDVCFRIEDSFREFKVITSRIYRKGEKPKRRYCIIAYFGEMPLFVTKDSSPFCPMEDGTKLGFCSFLKNALKTKPEKNSKKQAEKMVVLLKSWFPNIEFKPCKLV